MYNAENENAQDSVWINSILDKLDDKRKANWTTTMQKNNLKRFTISSTNGRSKVAIVYQNGQSNESIIFERILRK